MRHKFGYRKLNRTGEHRKALFQNMLNSLIKYEQIITTLTKAKELKAAGAPVIGFGAGEPDFPTPSYIVEAAVSACTDPVNHRYSPAGGLPDLKEAIAAKTLRDSGLAVSPNQVVVTNGGKHAVYNCMQVILNAGDEVLLPAPYLTTYPEYYQSYHPFLLAP